MGAGRECLAVVVCSAPGTSWKRDRQRVNGFDNRKSQAGYKNFLIETYDSPTFEKARSFYKAKGFSEIGRIEDYLPDGAAMIVFGKRIQN